MDTQERPATPAENFLHGFRKDIDANIKTAEAVLGMIDDDVIASHKIKDTAGREMALVRTKLQEAKMWAGKCLEVIGSPFPQHLRDESNQD